jgi:hypothetical protein
MIPLKIRRLFRGCGPGRFTGMIGSIFAHCSSLNQNKFARIGWPPNRLTNLLNLHMVNRVLTLDCCRLVATAKSTALGHKRTLARHAHRVLLVAAYEVINVPQSFRQWFSAGVAPVAPEAEAS